MSYKQALELAAALKVIVSTADSTDAGELDCCTEAHVRSVTNFIASLFEGIEVPQGSLSETQKRFIIGTLLYSYAGSTNSGGESENGTTGDYFASLVKGVDVLCALIKLEQEQEFYA
jgi:hypothetical protein